ncbi:MAG: metallophosphoesterase [Planctomycetota bacterium]
MNLLTSDDPSRALVAFETDEKCVGRVHLRALGGRFALVGTSPAALRHEVRLAGLEPGRRYEYRVEVENEKSEKTRTPAYGFETAPEAGTGDVVFAFASDSREGVGGGERSYMGLNLHVLRRIATDAYRRGARFFLFGGDLVNGYTSEPDDFTLQLKGFKEAFAGFWRGRPVYPAMGNHETLLNVFEDGSRFGLSLDKWPYSTVSAEAVFAREFFNPTNGPAPSDPRRPAYAENVYSFRFGPVLSIAFNNNYWWTTNDMCSVVGGSPEGYLMEDQLEWIEGTLLAAERDERVRFVVLYAQEPVFPCGGHVGDAMWWRGDNRHRAYARGPDGAVAPAGKGMIEVRNRFWRAIAKSKKTAVVLTGDEHEYHRLRVDARTPVGVYPDDDLDGDGVLDRHSPDPSFTHPVWHVTAGTAGAPYYSREPTPWTPVKLSSQSGYCLFRVKGEKLSLTYYSLTGQAVDHVDDLMAVKRPAPDEDDE